MFIFDKYEIKVKIKDFFKTNSNYGNIYIQYAKKIIVHLKKQHNFKDCIKKMSFPLKYFKFFLDILSSIVLRIYLCIGELIAFHTY